MTARAKDSTAALIQGLLLLAAVVWLMQDTAAVMVSTWSRSETFTHAFLVPPIVLWLAWRRRGVLGTIDRYPVPWLLLPVAATCGVWMVAELAGVVVAAQLALVTLIVLLVPTLFGWAVARELAFPLAFLYFAVPIGEFAVPQLMDWTADFTVAALRFTGIPVYREGLNFVIPSGHWSVVDACSGVRYLIASFMVGTLFAYLNYRSLRRRLVFMAISIVVPVLANWVRAYMIVMIGHLSGNELAVGVDHLIYGWVFFGIVIGAMFFIGMRWSEPEAPSPAPPAGHATAARYRSGWWAAVVFAALVGGADLAANGLRERDARAATPVLVAPAASSAWRSVPDTVDWVPGFQNPAQTRALTEVSPEGSVRVWIGYYRGQRADSKLVSSINRLVSPDDEAWDQVDSGTRRLDDGTALRTASLRRGRALDGASGRRLRAWQLYWVDGRWIAGDVRAKLAQVQAQLSGRGDDGAVVVLATPLGERPDDADATLEKFARERLGAIDAALRATRDTR